MFKAIILEDETRAMRVLKHQLAAYPELEIVASCETLAQARKAILSHQPDVVFLDIQIHSRPVFPLVDSIWESGLTPAIIFVTSWGPKYLEEAVATCGQLFQWSYLTKPVEDEKLAEVIGRFIAAKAHASRRGSTIVPTAGSLAIKKGKNIRLIDFSEIVYCESNGNYVNIYHLHKRQLKKRIWNGSLRKLITGELPTESFYRITSKHVININFLKGASQGRKYCVLDHEDLPEEIELWVTERARPKVWKDLLNK